MNDLVWRQDAIEAFEKEFGVSVRSLYRGQTRSAQVAIFLALLELSKNGHIDFSEDGEFITEKKRTEDNEAH